MAEKKETKRQNKSFNLTQEKGNRTVDRQHQYNFTALFHPDSHKTENDKKHFSFQINYRTNK